MKGKINMPLRLIRQLQKSAAVCWDMLDWRHPNFHSVAPVAAALALILVVGLVHVLSPDFYRLTPADQALIGPLNSELSKQLSYDPTTQLYQYNKRAETTAEPDSPQAALAAAEQAKKVGGGAKNYAVDLHAQSGQGTTVHDTTDTTGSLAIQMIPEFTTRDGKLRDGRVIYPLKGLDGKLVYSVKANGLKEDLLIPDKQGDSLSFSYQLKLPSSLDARLMPDGNLGIYSADASLFGNISYGSDADRAKVEAARQNGQKTNLVFEIPAPVIVQHGKDSEAVKASFKLTGDQLVGRHVVVNVSGLDQASYPLSIDPSIVVSSANNSFAGGNLEGMIEINSANNQLRRATLTGATVPSWGDANAAGNGGSGSSFANPRYAHSSVAYNGYLYVIGGCTAGNCTTITPSVQYAAIHSDGSMGVWAATSALNTARQWHASVAYNGYIYTLGGAATGGAQNTIEYAKVNPDGSLISWVNNSTVFTTARFYLSAVASNGFIYIAGGAPSTSSQLSDSQYAPIEADGSLGSWTSGTTLGTAVSGAASAVYNGYIYMAGGCTNLLGSCLSYTNVVQYAILNSDGSLGTWKTTTALPANRLLSYATAYNGYLYVMGGDPSGSYVSTVYYAPLNNDGTLGGWSTTTSFTTGRAFLSGAAYNGYLYVVGGCGAGSCSSILGDVQYAKINSAGVTGQYTTSANNYDSSGRCGQSAAAYGGYIYVMGGNVNCTGSTDNTVRYAQIGNDGSVGSWTSGVAYGTAGRLYMGAVVYAGYLYLVGGSSGTNSTTEVDYAYIGGGAPGAFTKIATSTGALTTQRMREGVVAYGGYIYAYGGANSNNSNVLASAEYAPINSDGSLGAWTLTNPMASARRGLAATTINGYVYAIAGNDGTSNGGLATVEYALICNGNNTGVSGCSSTQGSLGTWSSSGTSNLPIGLEGVAALAYKGFIYVTGGYDGSSANTSTWYAKTNSNGTLGSWITTSSFSPGVFRHNLVLSDNYLYVVGGCTTKGVLDACNAGTAVVQYAPVNNGGAGSASSWTSTTATGLAARWRHATVAYNGYLYVVGGDNGSANTTTVYYAALNKDGTTGSWNDANAAGNGGSGSSFTTSRHGLQAVAYNGYLYITGGVSNSSVLSDTQYAPINANGSLGAWVTSPNTFTTARFMHTSVAYNGYIYVIGGCTTVASLGGSPGLLCSNSGGALNDVQYAAINANGSLGSWKYTYNSASSGTQTGGFTTARYGHTSVVVNGNVYILGGCSTINGTGQCTGTLSDVQYASLNANGTVGTWVAANGFGDGRFFHGSAAMNGYLYVFAGFDANSVVGDTQYAPILSNGSLGAWNSTTSISPAKYSIGGGAAYNGYFYAPGGSTGNSTNTVSTVYFAGQQAIARKGTYSNTTDFGGDAVATKLLYNGTVPAGSQMTLGMRDALSSSPTFGSLTSYATMPGTFINLATSEKRYRQMVFTFDDSQAASFPDATTTQTTVSDYTMYFHPASNTRLRGGQTFINQGLNTLDAQPN